MVNAALLIDSDNDGVADYKDLDSDNDGILDSEECKGVEVLAGSTFTGNGTPGTGASRRTNTVTGWTISNGDVYSVGNSYI